MKVTLFSALMFMALLPLQTNAASAAQYQDYMEVLKAELDLVKVELSQRRSETAGRGSVAGVSTDTSAKGFTLSLNGEEKTIFRSVDDYGKALSVCYVTASRYMTSRTSSYKCMLGDRVIMYKN